MDFPSRPVDALPANRHVDSERAHGQHDTLLLKDRRTAETPDDGVRRLYGTGPDHLKKKMPGRPFVLMEKTIHLFITGSIESVRNTETQKRSHNGLPTRRPRSALFVSGNIIANL
jgi:hypothetical protein